MSHQPERALTLCHELFKFRSLAGVEMSHQPERALTHGKLFVKMQLYLGRNELLVKRLTLKVGGITNGH